MLRTVKGSARDKALPAMLTFDVNSVMVQPIGPDGSSEVTLPTVADVNFPPYDKVVPARDKAAPTRPDSTFGVVGPAIMGLNASYLSDAGKALKVFANDKSGGVEFRAWGPREPVRLDASNGEASATVIIMPMRI